MVKADAKETGRQCGKSCNINNIIYNKTKTITNKIIDIIYIINTKTLTTRGNRNKEQENITKSIQKVNKEGKKKKKNKHE